MVNSLLAVAFGGALGSLLRYGVGLCIAHIWPPHSYIATVLVNIVGSFLVGSLFAWFALRPESSDLMRLLLITGFLGGFTTFSAFSLDALRLISDGESMNALLYMGVTLCCGLLATLLGIILIKFYL
ncbi:MAG: fluoride efflux transporter CrcB [Campylobacteraceae bacterium]|nr:fluoride efflux transporter CrcB [Campylobacteraceae bacterium]